MKRLLILGGGESGVGTAILGKQQGYEVFLSDGGSLKEKYRNVLREAGIAFEENGHSEERLQWAELVMKSPGIPDKAAPVKVLVSRGVPVISEIEFAARYTNAMIIAITGSNGKTTTTLLTHHLLHSAGLDAGLAGNIGDSFAQMVALSSHGYYVLEISSFQLDGIVDFRPHVAVITNITPDHLDRYEYSFEKYIDSKFRITMNQREEDFFIYDADDPVLAREVERRAIRSRKLPVSLVQEQQEGAWLEGNTIKINANNEILTMSTDAITLEGKHNLKNAMAASTVATLLKIRKATIRESLQHFQGVEHRLEPVLKVRNVNYINDSKATNVNATFYALESMKSPTVWIAGGQDKGNDYLELMPLVREKVKALICLGVDNEKLIQSFGKVVEVIAETQSMKEAVAMAARLSEPGDNVLLSPACASFDLFQNYEDRGRQFKEAVREL